MTSSTNGKSSFFFPAVLAACLLVAGFNLFSLSADIPQLIFDGLLFALGILFLVIAIRLALARPTEPARPVSDRPRGLFGVPVERRNLGERRSSFFRPSVSQHGRNERRRRTDRRAA